MISTLVSWLPTPVRKQFENRITLLRAAENTGWMVANSAVRVVIAMVVGIWVARYLGAAQFGIFNYVLSLNMLYRVIIPLGTSTLVMRDLARSHEERGQILGSVFVLQMILAVAMVVASIGIAYFFEGNDPLTQKYTIILAMTLLIAPADVLILWYQSQLLSVNVAIANTISLLTMAAARVWLVQIEATLDAFIYLVVVERTVNLFVQVYLYQRSGESLWGWKFEAPRAWHLVREGMPLFWANLANTIFARSSELMLMSLAGSAAVGYYAAANKISALYLLIPAAMAASATPIISKSRTIDKTLYLTQFTNLLRLGSAIAIVSMVFVTLIANWLMPVLYGEEFAGAGPVLAISLWSSLPVTIGIFFGNWAINEGLARVQFEKVLGTAAVVTLLNWLLIPDYGASGAAISMLVAVIIVHIVWDFIDPRMRTYNLLKLHAFLPWWFALSNIKLIDVTVAAKQDELLRADPQEEMTTP